MFQNAGQASTLGDESTARESCSGSKDKKQRVAKDNEGVSEGKPESANKPYCISSKDDSGFETTLKMCEPYVNKLRDYWHKRQNAVIFDGQDRLHKVMFFVLSLLDNVRKPILLLAASNTLSMWEAFLKWSKTINVITYKGIKDAREFLSALESYSEKQAIKVLVILSSPDVFVEDMEIFDLKWELILIDECQRAVVATHFQKIKMLVADMKLLMVTGEMVDDSGFETTLKMCEPYVNKLRDYWHKRQNAVIFDGQDRLHKVMFFVLSLLDNVRKPILLLAASNTLSMWEAFLKWSKTINVITYKGIKDAREFLSALESYSEKQAIKVLVILSSPDVFVEDMEIFDLKWELILIDECQRAVDVRQSYNSILSVLDSKCTEIHADADLKTNDNAQTLKERLSPYIAFKCNFTAREFKEYWVPVHLSSMQIEQYCSLLESNMERLSSSLKTNTSLHDILIQTRKCCDHPYLVDPTLRNSSKKDVTVDPMDADITLSGKLQLLDKLLLEIKRRSLRVLVLFQPVVSSENISTGDMLDDLVHRRFGEDSYIRIGTFKFRVATEKRKEALNMFNNVNSKKFVCLLDYHSCHFCIKFSRVDVVILFNSDANPLNDIKSIQKVTIGPRHEPLKIFRLYSSFTVEEKALIFSKHGTTLDSNISYNNCQRLLAWGASYLYSNLRGYTNSKAPSSDDIVHEFSYVLQNKSGYTGPSNRSIISNAQLHNGCYPKGVLLFGETEVHTKESASVHECLIGNGPLVFWSNLFKESQHRKKNSCSQSSRRVQKSTQDSCSPFKSQPKTRVNNNENGLPAWKTKAKRTKREKRDKAVQSKLPEEIVHTEAPAHVSGHRSPEMSSNLDQERDKFTKSHQDKKSMLLSVCEEDISKVREKYVSLIHESEMCFTKQMQILEEHHKLVNAHKLLAEFMAQHCRHTNYAINNIL
nr:chromodomain-helicase-DNA-binding protein 3-like isoform X4 [Tanacetum cinerariifolium]